MNLIRALLGVLTAVLRSVTSSLVLLISTLVTAVVIVLVVGFFATGLTGVVGLRLSRRRSGKDV